MWIFSDVIIVEESVYLDLCFMGFEGFLGI